VEANDTVIINDSLAKVTSPKIVSYIEEYENWLGKLEVFESSKKRANKESVTLLETKINGLNNEIIKVRNEMNLAESAGLKETKNLQLQLENSEKQHERNKQLHTSEVISDLEFEGSLKKLQVAQQSLISTKEKYALQVAEIDSRLQLLINTKQESTIELSKLKAEFDYEIDDIRKNFNLAEKKIELNYGNFRICNNSITLLSPVNGKINLRTEKEYELPAGEILLRIQTGSAGFYIFAEAGPKDIGHVKLGTKAVLKYKSFPHYYYGTMEAEVVSVSPSPAENGTFPVKLNIVKTGKLDSRVTKGMTGTASFVVEEKTVFDFILRAFLKVTTID
jgi:multidrug efflux pump subunit AcrA (membrane-fusion protein)